MIDTAKLRALIEALAAHPISGYEWDCDTCEYRGKGRRWRTPPPPGEPEGYYDPNGNHCDHDDLIDRRLVLALLKDD